MNSVSIRHWEARTPGTYSFVNKWASLFESGSVSRLRAASRIAATRARGMARPARFSNFPTISDLFAKFRSIPRGVTVSVNTVPSFRNISALTIWRKFRASRHDFGVRHDLDFVGKGYALSRFKNKTNAPASNLVPSSCIRFRRQIRFRRIRIPKSHGNVTPSLFRAHQKSDVLLLGSFLRIDSLANCVCRANPTRVLAGTTNRKSLLMGQSISLDNRVRRAL